MDSKRRQQKQSFVRTQKRRRGPTGSDGRRWPFLPSRSRNWKLVLLLLPLLTLLLIWIYLIGQMTIAVVVGGSGGGGGGGGSGVGGPSLLSTAAVRNNNNNNNERPVMTMKRRNKTTAKNDRTLSMTMSKKKRRTIKKRENHHTQSVTATNTTMPAATKDDSQTSTTTTTTTSTTALFRRNRNQHRIPNILTFTHSINLLRNDTNVTIVGEDVALQRNVYNTIQLHTSSSSHQSTPQVYFWTDEECIVSIRNVMGHDTPLVEYFRSERHGMYKADICRGVALYEHGGLYFDVDVQTRMNVLDDVIRPNTTFVTSYVHRQSKYPGAFFQAFIGVVPRHPIMKRYVQLFVDHYRGKVDVRGPLGVLLLRRAYDDVVKGGLLDPKENVELWQEVLYSSQLFPNVPPPNWGTRRACHFVVVANRKRPFVVPLYSRVKGSRMCGGKESNANLRGTGAARPTTTKA